MKTKVLYSFLAFSSLFFVNFQQQTFCQSIDTTALKFSKIITGEDAKKHLSVIASDDFEGRETGKPGQKKAAKYIAEDFKTIGLKPGNGNTYLQKFPLQQTTPDSAVLKVGEKDYKNMRDFYVFPMGKDINLKAHKIIFAGYGISPRFENDNEFDTLATTYDDYKNLDVKNKIVMVLDGEPIGEDSVSFITGTKELSDWAENYRMKADLAKSKGASAIIIVSSNFYKSIRFLKSFLNSREMRSEDEKTGGNKRIPHVGISAETANEALASEKMTVDDIKQKISSTKKSVSFEIKIPVELSIKIRPDTMGAENVLGVIEGTEFKNEYIFVTAHYDHLGVRNGVVYNGADDDGSGTTGVLEIANAFEKAKEAGFAPKRTMVFMTVSGEEEGLLGSSYYTNHPIFPIANTVCDLNMDMIGRIDEDHKKDSSYIYLIGSDKISTELHKINENANATYTKLTLDYKYNDPNDPNRFYYRSDHYNFAKKGVPIIFYFNGVHEDYHQPTDKVAKINFDLLAKRAQLVFFTAWEVANRKDRIKSDVVQKK